MGTRIRAWIYHRLFYLPFTIWDRCRCDLYSPPPRSCWAEEVGWQLHRLIHWIGWNAAYPPRPSEAQRYFEDAYAHPLSEPQRYYG